MLDHCFDEIHYYPFGMIMPGRKYSGGSVYRYGFNGKEYDNEIKGEGNQQDYGMRIYDTRIGRFLSVDPIAKKYPDLTPYQFSSNRPVDGIDIDGLEYASYKIFVDKNKKVTKIELVYTDYLLKKVGTKGPGIEYVTIRVDEGNKPDDVRFVKNIYGIYQGGKNPSLPKVGGNYKVLYDDYSLDPIDETDANAKQHDLDYDNAKLSGVSGILDDKSSPANKAYIARAEKTIEKQKKGENDNVTKKPVTKEAADAAEFGKKWFLVAEGMKNARILRDDKTQFISPSIE